MRTGHCAPALMPTTKTFALSAVSATASRFRDDGAARHHGNPGKSGACNPFDGARADRGQIEAPVLCGLRRLDQHAPASWSEQPSLRAQFGDALQHLVGALRGLDREHVVVGHDAACPMSNGPMAASSASARAISASSRSRRPLAPERPSGTRISGATSCAPTMRKPCPRRSAPCPRADDRRRPDRARRSRGNSRKVSQSMPELSETAGATRADEDDIPAAFACACRGTARPWPSATQ